MAYPLTPITCFDGLTAPERSDPATFPDRADAWVDAEKLAPAQFLTLGTQVNVMATDAQTNAGAAATSASNAATSASSAATSAANAASNAAAPKWVSGTNYIQGATVWSPADPNMGNYRAKVALNPSNTDPFNDPTNWVSLTATALAAVEVLSISADTSLTSTSKNIVRVASTVRGASLLLPAGTAIANKTAAYPIKNVGAFAIPLRDQSGTLLAILPGNGSSAWAVCADFTTSASQWFITCPDGMPAQAFAAATTEAVTANWLGVSAIPGVANKAVVAWSTGSAFKAAIATRNPSTGAVTIGAVFTIAASITGSFGLMLQCMTSTTALAAANTGAGSYIAYSLNLNTSTDVITLATNVGVSNSPTAIMLESVTQLDTTRAAWLCNVSGTIYLNIATWAASSSTAVQTSLSGLGAGVDSSIIHVGSGNIMLLGIAGNTLYSTSGNTPTQLSNQSYSGLSYLPNASASILLPFSVQTSNKATFLNVSYNSVNTAARDSAHSIIPSGSTVPFGPTNQGCFGNNLDYVTVASAVIGSSYCAFSSENGKYAYAMRVMRYMNDQLTEVCYGKIEGLPLGRVNSSAGLRMAAVSGQAAIAIGLSRLQQPQVFSVEVIKA